MLTQEERARTCEFLHRLRQPTGGYSEASDTEAALLSTVAAVKALHFLGDTPEDPDGVRDFVVAHFEPGSGGFAEAGSDHAGVFPSAMALIALHDVAAFRELQEYLPGGLEFIASHASTREEHFMVLGAFDECEVPGVPPAPSISYFHTLRAEDLRFGPTVLGNAIASSALLRVHVRVDDLQPVVDVLLAGQAEDGGFGDGGHSDLWTTYCVMRALDLVHDAPDITQVAAFIRRLFAATGGFRSSAAAGATASATYQALSVLDWCVRPVLSAARAGDTGEVEAWLLGGGDPDVEDLQGWTPLLAAAARGHAHVVELLLRGPAGNGPGADVSKRLASADASATFLAGQGGDIETVNLLLEARPASMFDVCTINGGTLLLQTAFYGSERHRQLAAHLLDDVGELLGIGTAEQEAIRLARKRLLVASNVRGVNALETARMWGNEEMVELFARYDETTAAERRSYLDDLLDRIATPVPSEQSQRTGQGLTEKLLDVMARGLTAMEALPADSVENIEETRGRVLSEVQSVLEDASFEIDRLGGPLGQPPLVAVLTDGSTSPHAAALRFDIASRLLRCGADPKTRERHPMAVGAVIRAAVLNHFDLLQLLAEHMKPLAFAAEMNVTPPINGQTALLDSVHRALTASDETLRSHLEQIRWAIGRGARYDIEDHTGQTPETLAKRAAEDAIFRERAAAVVQALGLEAGVSVPPEEEQRD